MPSRKRQNVTANAPVETARVVRVCAERRGMSVSRWAAEKLHEAALQELQELGPARAPKRQDAGTDGDRDS